MTVSNVINGNLSRVSKETADRVRKIIEESQYEPNLFARSLSAKKSHIVAVMLPTWDNNRDNLLADPYNQEMVGLLEADLRRRGYYMMMRSYRDAAEAASFLRKWNIDGAILFYPFFQPEEMQAVLSVGVPTVLIDRFYPDLPTVTVGLDDYQGGYVAGKYLLHNGHRELGFAGPCETPSDVVENRRRGLEDALAERGLVLREENVFHSNSTYAGGVAAGKALAGRKEHRPSAVFVTVDIAAIGMIEGLRHCGLFVPDDVSLIGCDNWHGCQFCEPKLTTMAQDFAQKAQQVTRLLMEAIRRPPAAPRSVVLEMELLERHSVRRLH